MLQAHGSNHRWECSIISTLCTTMSHVLICIQIKANKSAMLLQVHVLQQQVLVGYDAVKDHQLPGSLGYHLRNLMNDHHWCPERLSEFICLHIILVRHCRCHLDEQHPLEVVAHSACCHLDDQRAVQQVSVTDDCFQCVHQNNRLALTQFGHSWMVLLKTLHAGPIRCLHMPQANAERHLM